nr:MAG TPA: hypothetical protein [Caudoviricetes sp.]
MLISKLVINKKDLPGSNKFPNSSLVGYDK